MKMISLASLLLAGVCFNANAGSFKTVYTFKGKGDGGMPYGSSLAAGNGYLYGLEEYTADNKGVAAFAYDTQSNTAKSIYKFNNPQNGTPTSSLIYLNGFVYGETSGELTNACMNGEAGFCGTIYSIDAISNAYTTLYTFMSGGNDGSYPMGGLTVLNGSLYGVTDYGGVTAQGGSNYGTIFSYNLTTNSYASVYSFDGELGDHPDASLTLVGNSFYLTTGVGGQYGGGTIFKISPSGRNGKVVYAFNPDDGDAYPAGGLIYRNKSLSGFTNTALFNIGIAGAVNWSVTSPEGDLFEKLVQVGSYFYGETRTAGASKYGSVFKVDANTGAITTLYNFTGQADGAYPEGGLTFANGVLYGVTNSGGSSYGTIFQYTP